MIDWENDPETIRHIVFHIPQPHGISFGSPRWGCSPVIRRWERVLPDGRRATISYAWDEFYVTPFPTMIILYEDIPDFPYPCTVIQLNDYVRIF